MGLRIEELGYRYTLVVNDYFGNEWTLNDSFYSREEAIEFGQQYIEAGWAWDFEEDE